LDTGTQDKFPPPVDGKAFLDVKISWKTYLAVFRKFIPA
jgi:hypothetical protein